MRPKPSAQKAPGERVVQDIRRATRKHCSAEDKVRSTNDCAQLVSDRTVFRGSHYRGVVT